MSAHSIERDTSSTRAVRPTVTTETTIVEGKTIARRSLAVGGKKVLIKDGLLRTATIADEWYDDIEDPRQFIEELRQCHAGIDVFTFLQRLPDVTPRYAYQMEPESLAVLSITSFAHWQKAQLTRKARNKLRKSEKLGLVVKPVTFDDEFIDAMVEIFNESPFRQGKPFWHYGKDRETIRREFSRFLFREEIFAAHHEGEVIGFIFLAHAGRYALLGQIISKIKDRDKSPNNALIAKAVEVCEAKGIPQLVYSEWSGGTLGDFKEQHGFQRVDVPRYHVPLTLRGRVGLKLGLHRGVSQMLPTSLRSRLIEIRNRWYSQPVVKPEGDA